MRSIAAISRSPCLQNAETRAVARVRGDGTPSNLHTLPTGQVSASSGPPSKTPGIGKVLSTYDDLILEGDKVSEMLQAFRSFIGENQMMAYFVMMAVRLNLGSMHAVEGCTA
ncbi:MAG: hypothetical protein WKF34_14340 [Pyrinomonadaceae bacterium]